MIKCDINMTDYIIISIIIIRRRMLSNKKVHHLFFFKKIDTHKTISLKLCFCFSDDTSVMYSKSG